LGLSTNSWRSSADITVLLRSKPSFSMDAANNQFHVEKYLV
jgi:hypothetical protein